MFSSDSSSDSSDEVVFLSKRTSSKKRTLPPVIDVDNNTPQLVPKRQRVPPNLSAAGGAAERRRRFEVKTPSTSNFITLKEGDVISLRSYHTNEGKGYLGTTPKGYFRADEPLARSAKIRVSVLPKGFAFQTEDGMYLSARRETRDVANIPADVLAADRRDCGVAETFNIEPYSATQIRILAYNGSYVTAEAADDVFWVRAGCKTRHPSARETYGVVLQESGAPRIKPPDKMGIQTQPVRSDPSTLKEGDVISLRSFHKSGGRGYLCTTSEGYFKADSFLARCAKLRVSVVAGGYAFQTKDGMYVSARRDEAYDRPHVPRDVLAADRHECSVSETFQVETYSATQIRIISYDGSYVMAESANDAFWVRSCCKNRPPSSWETYDVIPHERCAPPILPPATGKSKRSVMGIRAQPAISNPSTLQDGDVISLMSFHTGGGKGYLGTTPKGYFKADRSRARAAKLRVTVSAEGVAFQTEDGIFVSARREAYNSPHVPKDVLAADRHECGVSETFKVEPYSATQIRLLSYDGSYVMAEAARDNFWVRSCCKNRAPSAWETYDVFIHERGAPPATPTQAQVTSIRPKILSYTDKEGIRTQLDVEGYAVIGDILPAGELQRLKDLFWESQGGNCGRGRVRRNDPSTWSMLDDSPICQSDFMWGVRCNERIYKVFAAVHGVSQDPSDKALCVSLDGYKVIGRRVAHQGSLSLHDDQTRGPEGDKLYSIQGALNLEEVRESDEGLVVVPGSHKWWNKRQAGKYHHDSHFKIIEKNEDPEKFAQAYRERVKLLVDAGCLIVWNSHLLHGNQQATADRTDPSRLNRLTCFVCMMPKHMRSRAAYNRKRSIYWQGAGTNHYATLGQGHPLHQPKPHALTDTYPNIRPEREALF